jgi:hypothetical protein
MSAFSLMHVKILCMSFAPHIQLDARVCDEDKLLAAAVESFPCKNFTGWLLDKHTVDFHYTCYLHVF